MTKAEMLEAAQARHDKIMKRRAGQSKVFSDGGLGMRPEKKMIGRKKSNSARFNTLFTNPKNRRNLYNEIRIGKE
jgi:hypothetical protein